MGELDATERKHWRDGRSRLTLPQLLTFTSLIVAGGMLFCGPNEQEVQSSHFTLGLYAVVLAVTGAAAVHLRQIFGDHVYAQGERPESPQPLRLFLADALLMSVLTLAALKLCEVMFAHQHPAIIWLESVLYFGVLACCVRLLQDRNRSLAALSAGFAAVPSAGESAKLPSSELHYVEAEDHYVKLVFSDRVEHKRARFSDVINSLGDAGLRVHKSFWVNRHFVTGTRRSGRRLVLVLKDGVEIPVGRSNERKVVDALALPQATAPGALADGIRTGPAQPGA